VSHFEETGTEFNGQVVKDKNSGKRMVVIFDPDGNRIQLFED
jgi:predicted enzyme related to lactoylglutathione lyase